MMRNDAFFLRFFSTGVGVMLVLLCAPLQTDAGFVRTVKEWIAGNASQTIVIDNPHDSVSPMVNEEKAEPRATVVQATMEETFATRAMIDEDATDALWNTRDGSFTMVDDTGVWMAGDGAQAGEDVLARDHNATDMALAYDRDGHPIAVWVDEAHVYVSQWRDGAWRGRGTDASWDEVAQSAMACDDAATCRVASPQVMVDGDGTPVVAWVGVRGAMRTVFVARWDGQTWAMLNNAEWMTMNDVADVTPSMQMTRDGAGRPAVVYTDGTGARFTRWNGTQWVKANGDAGADMVFAQTTDAARRVYMHYDVHADAPALTAITAHNHVAHVAWRDGQWQAMPDIGVTDGAGDTVRDVDVIHGADHAPIVAMIVDRADATTELRMFQSDRQQWKTSVMTLTHDEDGVRMHARDAQMPVVICYDRDGRNGAITAGLWTGVEVITPNAAAPGVEKIAAMRGGVDRVAVTHTADDMPAVAFAAGLNLYTIRWNGQTWTAMDQIASGEQRIATGGVGAFVFANDANGAPALLWAQTQRAQHRVQYAFVPTVIRSPRTVQSRDVSGGAEGIVHATLVADADVPQDARIVYELSADGGATWQRAHKKEPVVFAQPGHDLRWRAQLYTDDDHHMPTLYGVRVTYDVQQTVADGVCGDAARDYGVRDTAFTGALCAHGVADIVPQFPAAGAQIQWQCQGGVQTAVCTATHADNARTSSTASSARGGVTASSVETTSRADAIADDRCRVETISGNGATAAGARVHVGGAYGDGAEMKFKMEAENTAGETIADKLYGVPATDGRIQLVLEGLQPRTTYRVKVKILVDGVYVFCPTVRTITTAAP